MKTFRVSIAGRVPFNYEYKVKAENEKQALAKALKMDKGEAIDEDNILWEEARVDTELTVDGQGVYIEEL